MADAKGAYIGGVPVQFKDAAARAMISDEYNSAETYAKGNLCIYNGKIYEAIKETTGTWDATAWEETTLAKVNSKLNGDIIGLSEKTNWTKVSFVGSSNSVDEAISSKKCANVPNTAKEITVDITVKRNSATTIKFSQSIKTYGEYCGGYYNSDKYYASYQIAYRRDIIMLYKSWLKVVDNGTAYNNADTVQVDVYYR